MEETQVPQKHPPTVIKWVRLPREVVKVIAQQAEDEQRSWANLAARVLIKHARSVDPQSNGEKEKATK